MGRFSAIVTHLFGMIDADEGVNCDGELDCAIVSG